MPWTVDGRKFERARELGDPEVASALQRREDLGCAVDRLDHGVPSFAIGSDLNSMTTATCIRESS